VIVSLVVRLYHKSDHEGLWPLLKERGASPNPMVAVSKFAGRHLIASYCVPDGEVFCGCPAAAMWLYPAGYRPAPELLGPRNLPIIANFSTRTYIVENFVRVEGDGAYELRRGF
jgi:hypothetical protein